MTEACVFLTLQCVSSDWMQRGFCFYFPKEQIQFPNSHSPYYVGKDRFFLQGEPEWHGDIIQ